MTDTLAAADKAASRKPYVLSTPGQADLYYSTKAHAVRNGELLGAAFTVTSPAGKVVHTATAEEVAALAVDHKPQPGTPERDDATAEALAELDDDEALAEAAKQARIDAAMAELPVHPEATVEADVTPTQAQHALDHLTANGKAVMGIVGRGETSFFDDGIAQGSGIYGSVLAQEAQVTAKPTGMGGVLAALLKQGMFEATTQDPDNQQDGEWFSLTQLGAEVALLAAETAPSKAEKAAPASKPATAKPATKKADTGPKTCKKDPSHGAHRVTKTGSYCYACDRIVAEAQKAERQRIAAARKAEQELASTTP